MCNSSQTRNGRNSDEKVVVSSAGGGDGVDSNKQEEAGVLRAAARAIWGTLRPYVVGEDANDFGECPQVGSSSLPLCLSFIETSSQCLRLRM